MNSYRCDRCGCIRYDRGQKNVMAFCPGQKICRAMKEEANNLIMHYYGVNGWTEFYEVGFDGAAWDNIDLKFIELFVKVEKACEEALL